jgi:hypothetical protein
MRPDDYPMGALVTYADADATTSRGMTGVAGGIVNGPAICDHAGDVSHIPVWSERDNGREPTTVYVHVANVLEVLFAN